MVTSSNGNIFRVTGHLCGEFTGNRLIPRTKASVTRSFDVSIDLRLELTLEETIKRLVIWDAIAPIMTSLYWFPVMKPEIIRRLSYRLQEPQDFSDSTFPSMQLAVYVISPRNHYNKLAQNPFACTSNEGLHHNISS